jgi:hypothetical protein
VGLVDFDSGELWFAMAFSAAPSEFCWLFMVSLVDFVSWELWFAMKIPDSSSSEAKYTGAIETMSPIIGSASNTTENCEGCLQGFWPILILERVGESHRREV